MTEGRGQSLCRAVGKSLCEDGIFRLASTMERTQPREDLYLAFQAEETTEIKGLMQKRTWHV